MIKKRKKSKLGVGQGIGGGRPKFIIDYEAVQKLAALQCTQNEIASYLGCSVDTLQRDETFCGLYKIGIDKGRMSLRRKQWQAAESGNNTMLVWLGKQYLGQRDKHETDHKSSDGTMTPKATLTKEEAIKLLGDNG